MNSGTSSTELNDMFTDFVNYVDSFYGQNDPLYPMMSQETKQPLTKYDIEFKCLKYVTDNADESSAKSWEENIATGSVLFQEWLKSNDYMPLHKAAHQM